MKLTKTSQQKLILKISTTYYLINNLIFPMLNKYNKKNVCY